MSIKQFLTSVFSTIMLCLVGFLLIKLGTTTKPINHHELFELSQGSYAVRYGDTDYQFERQFYVGADSTALVISNLNPGLTTVKVIDDHIREFSHGKAVTLQVKHGSLIVVWVYENATYTELGRWNITIDH